MYSRAALSLLLAILAIGSTRPADAQMLPEGNSGIAARYVWDSGITADSAVLFADDFESYTSSSQFTSTGRYVNYYHTANFAIDTATVFAGAKSLRIRMPSTTSEVANALVRRVSPTQDALFVRVYARYPSDYAGIWRAHNGVRITGKYTGPGRKPNGTDFFLVNIENSKESEPEPGYTHAYVYHPEQDDAYGENWYPDGSVTNGTQFFGPNFIARPKIIPAKGTWICYEVMVKLNTPGTRDGRVAVWQDGTLIADWQNVRFRDVDTLKIDEVQLENGGQSSSQQNDKWYDNLVIATSYIGPMASAPMYPPMAPTNLRAD